MMDYRKFLLILICCFAVLSTTSSYAASISGFVKAASNRPASGAQVYFVCPGNKSFSGTTDQYGRYRIVGLPDVQWCSLNINYQNIASTHAKVNTGSGAKDINIKLLKEQSNWRIIL